MVSSMANAAPIPTLGHGGGTKGLCKYQQYPKFGVLCVKPCISGIQNTFDMLNRNFIGRVGLNFRGTSQPGGYPGGSCATGCI